MDETKMVAVQTPNNTLGTVSLVTGILGVLLFFCCPYISVILGLTALVCGILGWQQQQKYALAGIILGVAATALGIIFAIIGQLFFSEIFSAIEREIRF
ncbi:MAG: DUF4190 domain-containing protein [Bacillota bacterium]